MKAKIKFASTNGMNNIHFFDNIKELKKSLDECLYYCAELILNVESNYTDNWKYSEVTDLRSLLSEAKFYDSVLCVNVIYELEEELEND